MPKVRNSSIHPIEFEVSPWQTKKRKNADFQESQADRPSGSKHSRQDMGQVQSPSHGTCFSIDNSGSACELDLSKVGNAAELACTAKLVAVCCIFLQAFDTSAQELQHAAMHAAPEQPVHTNDFEGMRRTIPTVGLPSVMSGDTNSSVGIFGVLDDPPEVAVREAMQRLLQQTQESDSAAPSMECLQLPHKLEGTACLAWLPDGQAFGTGQSSCLIILPCAGIACHPTRYCA